MKAVPDLATDYPKISSYLSHTLFTLIQLKAIAISDVEWLEPTRTDLKEGEEEDLVFVEQYYLLVA
jgi:hypothetical protein